MITSINEWKKYNMGLVKENTNLPGINSQPAICIDPNPQDMEKQLEMMKIINHAMSMEFTKENTINFVTKVLVNPAYVPDNISLNFLIENMGDIVKCIENIPDNQFPEVDVNFTDNMLLNDEQFECVMYIKDNQKIKKLAESLNLHIQKNNFKVEYNNGIFFINNLDKLNENNKNIVLNTLKECGAKNINEQLKWKRKLI